LRQQPTARHIDVRAAIRKGGEYSLEFAEVHRYAAGKTCCE
jgi:hypothetical protein